MVATALKSPVCKVCKIQYKSMEDFSKHMATNHGETDDMRITRMQDLLSFRSPGPTIVLSKSNDCTECGVIFNTGDELYKHIENHYSMIICLYKKDT